MLLPHSFLWHYLWIAPNVLLLILGVVLWKRRLIRQFPAFFAFTVLTAIGQLVMYAADVLPSVTAENFWRADWATLMVEALLKFAVIGEIFAQVFGAYASLARLGKMSIRAVGTLLVLTAALAAAFAPKNGQFGIISGAHLLGQTVFLIETGLLVFIFIFSSYFRLSLDKPVLGISLGLGVSASVHLATWAIMANGGASNSARNNLDFLNMATYHFCVLIWFYYLLVPGKVTAKAPVPLPENNLDVWNRELERLVHQ
jgi:hypothetical protein